MKKCRCKMLIRIKQILDNQEFSDTECVEEILCLLERLGYDRGERHDLVKAAKKRRPNGMIME